jgi:mannose PTS system EIIA component
MIGIVIVTHGRLGVELVNTAEFILGSIDRCQTVSIDGQMSPEEIRQKIARSIKAVDQGKGVLILTDMFGGTPSNISLSFLAEGSVEVLTGANLPMLVKLAQSREGRTLKNLAREIGAYGRKSVIVAGELLNQKPQT